MFHLFLSTLRGKRSPETPLHPFFTWLHLWCLQEVIMMCWWGGDKFNTPCLALWFCFKVDPSPCFPHEDADAYKSSSHIAAVVIKTYKNTSRNTRSWIRDCILRTRVVNQKTTRELFWGPTFGRGNSPWLTPLKEKGKRWMAGFRHPLNFHD